MGMLISNSDLANLRSQLAQIHRKMNEAVSDGDVIRAEELLDHSVELERRIRELKPRSKRMLSIGDLRWPVTIHIGVQRTVRLHRPPGARLLRIAEFLSSRQTFELIFEPTIGDLQSEYAAALAEGRIWKARWVRVRGYSSFARAAGLLSLVSGLRQVWRIWRSVQ